MMSAGEITRMNPDAASADYSRAADRSFCDPAGTSEKGFSEMRPDGFEIRPEQSIWNPEDAAPRSVAARPAPDGLMLAPSEYLSPRLDRMELNSGFRQTLEKLFHANIRSAAPYDSSVALPERMAEAELARAFERASKQFARIRGTLWANMVAPELMPGVIEKGLCSGIPAERIPSTIEYVFTEQTMERVRTAIEEGLLRVAQDSAENKAEASAAKVREPFKARAVDAAVATGMGVGTWLAAEEAAELLGIKNPTMRFAFVIYTMHYGMQGIDAGISVAKSVRAGETVGAAIRARIATAVAGETVAARAATLARGAGRVPIDLVRGIGVGLLMSKAVGGLAEMAGVDPEIAAPLSTAAFFSEMPINRLSGGRFAQACSRLGVAAVGEIAAIAMLAEVAAEGAAMAMRGDDNDYALSLESRAADANDEMMWEGFVHGTADWPSVVRDGAFVLYGLSEVAQAVVGFFLPGTMMRLKAVNYTLRNGGTIDSTIGNDEFWKKDADEAIEKSRDLPIKLRGVLEGGFYGDDLDPEFYRSVDLGWIGEAVDPDNNDNASEYIEGLEEGNASLEGAEIMDAALFLKATGVSRDIVSLHFSGYSSGERIRDIFDRDGFDEIEMKEGMEEDFLKEFVAPAYRLSSGSSAEEVRAAVIRARKKNLVAAILGADYRGQVERRNDLLKVAADVGVLDRELGFEPALYSETIEELAMAAMTAPDADSRDAINRVLAEHMGYLEIQRIKGWSEGKDTAGFTKRIGLIEDSLARAQEKIEKEDILRRIHSQLPPVGN